MGCDTDEYLSVSSLSCSPHSSRRSSVFDVVADGAGCSEGSKGADIAGAMAAVTSSEPKPKPEKPSWLDQPGEDEERFVVFYGNSFECISKCRTTDVRAVAMCEKSSCFRRLFDCWNPTSPECDAYSKHFFRLSKEKLAQSLPVTVEAFAEFRRNGLTQYEQELAAWEIQCAMLDEASSAIAASVPAVMEDESSTAIAVSLPAAAAPTPEPVPPPAAPPASRTALLAMRVQCLPGMHRGYAFEEMRLEDESEKLPASSSARLVSGGSAMQSSEPAAPKQKPALKSAMKQTAFRQRSRRDIAISMEKDGACKRTPYADGADCTRRAEVTASSSSSDDEVTAAQQCPTNRHVRWE